ncbi:MAG: hypothetical protein C4B59_05800 [Candidatus Methanogaster sp.]|uniref:Uncharacterized protein n=1 Tax=Candidatus Methanogaster sp. TaxID=3386292 RepID=A0AC61L3X5_9EURY|nr:MAG: hypothetical protein C4B59_05800 [ANME-2 cluster archaeon]
MTQEINLKELEKKAFRSYHEDGIWDIFLGLIMMAMAVNAFLSKIGVPELQTMIAFIGLELVAVIFLIAGKKRITVPRIGHVKFGKTRRAKLTKVKIVLALSVIFGLVALALGIIMQGDSSGVLLPLAWMVNALIVFSVMAYFMDFPRLYIIGILYAMVLPIDVALHEFGIAYIIFGIAATIILVMGLVILSRFLRDHPLPAEGVEL